jgi:hypothetical protein
MHKNYSSHIFQFPNAHHVGCHFHFTNSIYRQIQHLGLTTIYRDDEDVRSTARKLMALPLILLDKVDAAFDEIVKEAPKSTKPLIDYFNRFWMRKMKRPRSNMHDRKRPLTEIYRDRARLPYATRVHGIIRWETDSVYGDRTKVLSD